MASPVYFAPLTEGESSESIQKKVATLYDRAGFGGLFAANDLVAIKTHFGEDGNHNFVNPQYQVPIGRRTRELGGKPFWTETNTLYVGRRANAVDHLILANEHGFSLEATGMPIVIADGVSGREEVMVDVNGRHAKEVGIAPGVAAADALIVVSHATGHLACGYGGAIKNIGMGLSSRRGKLHQHSAVKPRVKEKLCRGDGACIKWCPTEAISMQNGKAVIDQAKCIGCGECLAACRPGAVTFSWKMESKILQERMVEQALGVARNKQGKIGYITFINNVGKDCDCLASREQDVLIKSLGIVASLDVVAIETATLKLIEERLGGSIRKRGYDIDYLPQLKYAEELGMGSSEYTLTPV